jgi:hypothetical protein
VKEDLYTVPLPTLEELLEVWAGDAGDEDIGWIGGTIVDGEATTEDACVDTGVGEAFNVDVPALLAMTPELAKHWE